MRISVIVTCYKEGRLLFNAFNSLQQQTTKDFEIILVNDCSTDPETIEACKTLSQTPGTTVIWNKNNLGLSGSRNIAIEKMKGEVVVLLDGDDTLPPTSIEYIKSAFASAANADLIFGDYLISDEIDRHTSKKDCSIITNSSNSLDPKKLLIDWILLGTSPFKKTLWEKLGGYSLEFSNTCQDVDFIMRAVLNKADIVYTNEVIYHWHKSKRGMNNSLAHKQALLICYYNNYDFLLKYAQNDDGLSIAFMHLDYRKLKIWAAKRQLENQKTMYSRLIHKIPLPLMPYFCRFILFSRRMKEYAN